MKTQEVVPLSRCHRNAFHFAGRFCATAILSGILLLECAPAARAAGYVFNIPANNAWTDTGLDVLAGSELLISATGTVIYGPEPQQVTGANGGDWTGAQYYPNAVYSNTIVVSLIGKIGGTTAIGTGTPLPEGISGKGLGFVGTSYDKVIPGSGRLFLGFNDLVGYFGDNSGSFSVSVTVVPEPSSLALLMTGALALIGARRVRRANAPAD